MISLKYYCYRHYQKYFAQNVLKQWIEESRELYPSQNIYGIEFVGPLEFIPTLSLTLEALKLMSPAEYGILKNNILTIYVHPNSMGWIGFGNQCLFISDKIVPRYEFVWSDMAGFLVSIAKINCQIRNNSYGAIFKWSSARRAINESELKTVALLSGHPKATNPEFLDLQS